MMTLRSFINYGVTEQKAIGINILYKENAVVDISYCVLQKEKDVVSIVKAASSLSSIQDLLIHLHEFAGSGVRLHVNFDGRGILMRLFSERQEYRHEDLFRELFPVANPDDFISQVYTGPSNHYLCIGKKEFLEECELLKSTGNVVSISLGAFVVGSIAPFILSDEVTGPGYSITFKDKKIDVVVQIPEGDEITAVSIGEDQITSDLLLAYAGAFSILFPSDDLDVNSSESIHRTVEEVLFWRKLHYASKIALFFMLGILCLNAVLYFRLQQRAAALQVQSRQYINSSADRNQETKQLTAALVEYEKIGWTSNVHPLYYCDQLANTVSPGVRLTTLEVGILNEENLRKGRSYYYQPDVIRVVGVANDALTYQQWLRLVEQLGWIRNISDQQYEYDSRLHRGTFRFNIQVL